MKAILLSGGMDSIALAFWQRPEVAITVNYGQIPADAEIRAASSVARELRMAHVVITVDCRNLGCGEMAGTKRIAGSPTPEWWPFRNQLLITLGAMHLAGTETEELMIGSVAGDKRHADGREEFVNGISSVVRQQEFGLRISAPAIRLNSAELIRESGIPMEILAWAHSCHSHSMACGVCRGCTKHRETYEALGMPGY